MRQEDRRRHPRYPMKNLPGSISPSDHPARVVDLAVGGMALETEAWLRLGRKYRFRLADGQRSFAAEGTVVRCRLDRTERGERGEVRPVYLAGVQFEELSQGARHRLVALIEAGSDVEISEGAVEGAALGER